MNDASQDKIRGQVRARYAAIAKAEQSSCCGGSRKEWNPAAAAAEELGYSAADVAAVPEGAEMGLGCGNPLAIASIRPGMTVVDLGSGGGFDCFLAADQTGLTGKVIGIDMTPEMISKARANAEKAGLPQVEFRLGEIEALPVGDNQADLILSNCVINLSPDKPRVFREALRILKPGGRLAIADIVATAEMPAELRADVAAYTGCVAGATMVGELERFLSEAGFEKIEIRLREETRPMISSWTPGYPSGDYVVSSFIEAVKPC